MESKEFKEEIISKYTPEEIEKLVGHMKEAIVVKNRKHYFKTYENCFLGTDMVQWLISNGHAENIDEAIELGDFLIEKNVFHHVVRDHGLKNKQLFYRFDIDEKSRGHCDPKDSWHNVLEDREGDLISPEEISEVLGDHTDWHKKNSDHLPELLLDKYNSDTLDNCRPIKWTDPEVEGKYDMIAIGAGAGGLVTAIGAALTGGKAAIIERNVMGGDCLNTGCVPSKAFIKSAKIAHAAKNGEKYGVSIDGNVKVDFAKVMERVREVRAKISEHDSVYKFANKFGIDIFLGKATFISPHEIQINDKILQFSKACVATGGRPYIPEIPGLEDFPVFTSENVFNITEQPKHLVVIGTGPIGCELGQSFARLGTQVTMISRGERFLPKEDPDAASYLHQQMLDDGVKIMLNTTPIGFHVLNSPGKLWRTGGKFELEVEREGQKDKIEGDSILVATGRRPNVHGMGLEEAGIEFDDKTGIKVDDYCKTTNKNVYSVGDVCSKYQFTHNSDHMARNVVKNALYFGNEKTSNLIMSWCTYTEPEVAHVGKYPRELEAEGIEYDTYKVNFADHDRAICESVEGMVKIHCKKGTDKILGSTIVGGPAGDMICSVAQAMYNKVGLGTFGAVVHPYPTFAEAFKALTSQYNMKKLSSTSKSVLRTVLKLKR